MCIYLIRIQFLHSSSSPLLQNQETLSQRSSTILLHYPTHPLANSLRPKVYPAGWGASNSWRNYPTGPDKGSYLTLEVLLGCQDDWDLLLPQGPPASPQRPQIQALPPQHRISSCALLRRSLIFGSYLFSLVGFGDIRYGATEHQARTTTPRRSTQTARRAGCIRFVGSCFCRQAELHL